MQDLIVGNGRVVDWAGGIDAAADIAVKDGQITAVGRVNDSARRRVDAAGLVVVPGIIDSHMHASSWLAGPKSYRMLALAGVTTALEMAGPLDNVVQSMVRHGSGITIGCLEMIRPGWNIAGSNPGRDELANVSRGAVRRGAFGVKLLGGHYPLTPEASGKLIRVCSDEGIYLGIHAGSTAHGSNIEGVEEIISLAEGRAFHLAHTNAYCRGSIAPIEDEIRVVADLLKAHPEIDSESYLSPINGCSGKCTNGVPESGITRNCLRSRGYEASEEGLRQAISDGFALVHATDGDVVRLSSPAEGLRIWLENQTNAAMSFPVNPALSRFYFATAKREGRHFLSDSFCTDGGGIPRNVIIENGLSLVKFSALTMQEFVFKSSTSAALLLGLRNKGRLAPGADADITVIDMEKQKAVHAFSMGRPTLLNGEAVGSGGTLLTTEAGREAAASSGLGVLVADMEALFTYRASRFNS